MKGPLANWEDMERLKTGEGNVVRGYGPQEMSKTSRCTKLGTVGNAGSNEGDNS